MRRRRSTAVGLVVAALALAVPAGAQAETICVGSVPGDGCNIGFPASAAGLQSALTSAEGNSGSDNVLIGAGTYVAPTAAGFNYDAPGQVQIIGAGQASTVLRAASVNPSVALDVSASGSSTSLVSNMTVLKGTTPAAYGLRLESAEGQSIAVREESSVNSGVGVVLRDDALLDSASISLTGFVGVQFAGGGTVRNSTIDARVGAETAGMATARSRSSAARSPPPCRASQWGGPGITGSVQNSVIHMTGVSAGFGLYAFTAGASERRT